MFGRDPILPVDLLFGHSTSGENELSAESYIAKIQERLRVTHNLARSAMLIASKKQKLSYDHRIKIFPYKEGDKVWLTKMEKCNLYPQNYKPSGRDPLL